MNTEKESTKIDKGWLKMSKEWTQKRSADFQYKGSKAYKQNVVRVQDSCINCKKRKAEYGDCTWCKKCAKAHNWEPFTMLDLGIFLESIQKHLDYEDIVALSGVSKEMNSYFNQNEVWCPYHMREVSLKNREKKKDKLMKKKYSSFVNEYVPVEGIYIQNKSTVEYSLYCKDPCEKIFTYMCNVSPKSGVGYGGMVGQIWLCVPTKQWSNDHLVEGVGHSFVIDPDKLYKDPGYDWIRDRHLRITDNPEKWMCYDHTIEDRVYKPMRQLTYKYKDHKTEFIKYKINPAKLQEKAAKNMMRLEEQQEELDILYRKIRLLETNIGNYKKKKKSYEKLKDIYKKYKPNDVFSNFWNK